MSAVIGVLISFFTLLSLMDIAVNWHVNASQFDD